MAQSRKAAARIHCAAGGVVQLAKWPPPRGHHSSRRYLGNHRYRRRSRNRNQFPAIDAAARMVHGQSHAVYLRLLGVDLWRWRARLSRRAVDNSAKNITANESIW